MVTTLFKGPLKAIATLTRVFQAKHKIKYRQTRFLKFNITKLNITWLHTKETSKSSFLHIKIMLKNSQNFMYTVAYFGDNEMESKRGEVFY